MRVPTYRCGCPAPHAVSLTAPFVDCAKCARPAPAPNSTAALTLASAAYTDYLSRKPSQGDARHAQAAKRRARLNEAPEVM